MILGSDIMNEIIKTYYKEKQLDTIFIGASFCAATFDPYIYDEQLGVKSNGGGMWSIYTGENVCKQLPTEELWNKLQDILDFEFPYEKIRQTFNPQLGVSDVWEDIDFYGEKERIHPTQKPLKLISRLVLASSDEGDLVLDPFMGSGTTAVSCVENRRKYIGFEIDRDYYEKSLVRLGVKTNEPS